MATTRRRKSTPLIEQLQQEPRRFDFFQTVRLLEQAGCHASQKKRGHAAQATGQYTPVNREVIRFSNQSSLAFSGSDISGVKEISSYNDEDISSPSKQWQVLVDIFGLIGSNGVLPFHDSEQVITRLRLKDHNLKDFLDIFNHRSISLLYDAWQKYRLPLVYERHQRQHQFSDEKDYDLFTQIHASLVGLGTSQLRDKMPLPDQAIMHFGGLLSSQAPSAPVIEQILTYYFGLPVTIEQFIGEWQPLPEDMQSRLPSIDYPKGLNNQLGINTILGQSCLQAQSKFRVRFDQLTYQEFMSLLPSGEKMKQLKALIRFIVGIDYDFDIALTIAQSELPNNSLGGGQDAELALGWNSQLRCQDEMIADTTGRTQFDTTIVRSKKLGHTQIALEQAAPHTQHHIEVLL
jgi:type VI secretion system protein ImpH